jgi:hypothetical protein
MEGPDRTPWFVGDLEDPWVVEIAEALPRSSARLPCLGELPEQWPAGLMSARTVVLHRPFLGHADAERVRKLRIQEAGAPRIVLCVGPHARYADLVRWSPLVDAILPEATASETVGRYVAGAESLPRRQAKRPPVTVVSGHYELRQTLVDACESASYPVDAATDWSEVSPGGLAVWDVPALDEDWPDLLAQHARGRSLITLIGFADRISVSLARSHGAAACLDLPCDPTDLTFVLDRLAVALERAVEPAHVVPPAPAVLRKKKRPVRARSPISHGPVDGRSGSRALQ